MRRDYQKMQERILPGRETQEWMWEEIEKKAAEKTRKHDFKFRVRMAAGVMAAVAVLAVCVPQTNLAKQITGFFKEYFFTDANVEQDITQVGYEDEDEHVRMQVQEMLSDGACIYCNICYEALDDVGRNWLFGREFDSEDIKLANVDDEFSQSSGWGWDVTEQKERATDKSRYFSFYHMDYSGNYNLKNSTRTLFYPMYRRQGIGKIKIESNMDTVTYRLEGEGSISKFFEPKYLVVSKLSYAVLGKDKGTYYRYINEWGTEQFHINEEYEAELDERDDREDEFGIKLSFIMENGLGEDAVGHEEGQFGEKFYRYKVVNAIGNGIGGMPYGVQGVDFVVTSGYFNGESYALTNATADDAKVWKKDSTPDDSESWKKNLTLDDPNALIAVKMDGIYYNLVKEEIAE